MTAGEVRILRIDWYPGSDTLVGTCRCGAEHLGEDPVTVWKWLLAHPEGHDPAGSASPTEPRGIEVPA